MTTKSKSTSKKSTPKKSAAPAEGSRHSGRHQATASVKRPLSFETPIYDTLTNELGDPMEEGTGVDAA